jgi:putative oxidoreductase
VGIGISYAFNHGYDKLFGGPDRWESIGRNMANLGIDFAPQFWGFMAGFAEFAGGIFLALGLFTRPFAAMLSFTMIVAILKKQAEGAGFTYPLEMLIVVFSLMIIGAGKYSLDHHIRFKK